jgi:hypothetical protein
MCRSRVIDLRRLLPLGSFFLGGHPSHEDYGKTKDDIEKKFFAFNCQLKKLNGKFFIFPRTTGSPVTRDLLYRQFQYKI